jgi:flagellar motor protein MotB
MSYKSPRRVNFIPKKSILPGVTRASAFLIATLSAVALAGQVVKTGKKAAESICRIERASIGTQESVPVYVPFIGANSVKADRLLVLQDSVQESLGGMPGVAAVEREAEGRALRVTILSDTYFKTGTANLEKKSEGRLKDTIRTMIQAKGITGIEIEGHTDDSPVKKQKNLYRSNWELSVARAATLLHVFEEAGYSKDSLKVAGFGDSRPVAPNRGMDGVVIPKNVIQNRRIVFRMLTANGKGAEKAGL